MPEDSEAPEKTTGDEAVGSYDSMELCELGLVRATAQVVSIDTWKDQLDFERACSAAVPGERCWLSGELTSWNRVLNSLEYELVETRPGSARLQKADCDDCDSDKSVKDVAREAAVLISWLLEHHLCIEELSLYYPRGYGHKAPPVPFPIRVRPSVGDLFELEGLDTVRGIEKLKVVSSKVTFKFAAQLESLLRRNASTLKAVKITKARLPRNVDYALRCLVNCESLTLCPYYDWGRRAPSLVSVAQLLRTTSALKNLSILICPIKRKKQLTTIAEAVKVNTSLTKLSVSSMEINFSPEPIFVALEANKTLKELQLQECNIGVFSGLALAKALWKNTSLRSLRITESAISADSMQLLAAVLRVNSTLEEIELSSRESLHYSGISVLCSSLAKNNTLKKLTLGKFRATRQEREALAQTLTTNDSYGRVQMSWAKPDINGLWNALISATACPEEVRLREIPSLPKEALELLFNAIASSERVRAFRALWEGNVQAKGAAFCEMLKSNRSIRILDIFIGTGNANLVHDVFHALAENEGITKVMIGLDALESDEAATDISYFLARNKTATSFYLTTVRHSLYEEFVEEFSKGMWQNRLIVDFKLNKNLICDEGSFTVFEAVRRNKAALNRAVDFILRHKADRECAEAFELFSKTPLLVSQAVKVTEKTEGEVLADVVSAANFLTDNYLTITGIVKNSVECHSAEGTQIAALNKDCWRAICRHLKVADVLVPQ
ncbi:hypothetical protein HPB52_018229 [Rhipicephalus sanguineus]|uniref:Ran gtpase-activating protein n=1 Tax=Rhipicephalus sanguineus TaxID=34632 RepID=A0A9D4PMG4_RHISA|nr:hypothetical protein HPB52_018229 [Rhipicephalus sanguineus]